jgi:hypothetical protein
MWAGSAQKGHPPPQTSAHRPTRTNHHALRPRISHAEKPRAKAIDRHKFFDYARWRDFLLLFFGDRPIIRALRRFASKLAGASVNTKAMR